MHIQFPIVDLLGMSNRSQVLDNGQYATSEIAKYEAIYGRNFVSPGGLATTQDFLARVTLRPGMKVLDVGCGLGGSAFYLASTFGVQVHGLDLSANMLDLARSRRREANLETLVTFERGDILDFDRREMYDLIYSRDVFLHIHDKVRLFVVLKQALAAGGELLFTDYCRGDDPISGAFADYVNQRNYALCTVEEYRRHLQRAGFEVISVEDRTEQFIQILEQELAHLPQDRLAPKSVAELTQSWQAKITRARNGEQRWGLCHARTM
jgi:phosphoethanolamine N-methyltransferase